MVILVIAVPAIVVRRVICGLVRVMMVHFFVIVAFAMMSGMMDVIRVLAMVNDVVVMVQIIISVHASVMLAVLTMAMGCVAIMMVIIMAIMMVVLMTVMV